MAVSRLLVGVLVFGLLSQVTAADSSHLHSSDESAALQALLEKRWGVEIGGNVGRLNEATQSRWIAGSVSQRFWLDETIHRSAREEAASLLESARASRTPTSRVAPQRLLLERTTYEAQLVDAFATFEDWRRWLQRNRGVVREEATAFSVAILVADSPERLEFRRSHGMIGGRNKGPPTPLRPMTSGRQRRSSRQLGIERVARRSTMLGSRSRWPSLSSVRITSWSGLAAKRSSGEVDVHQVSCRTMQELDSIR